MKTYYVLSSVGFEGHQSVKAVFDSYEKLQDTTEKLKKGKYRAYVVNKLTLNDIDIELFKF